MILMDDFRENLKIYFKQQGELFSDEFYFDEKILLKLKAPGLTLEEFEKQVSNCMECPLGKTRINVVFGVGSSNADLIFIGEAPGREEDLKGEPFVGRAGRLFDRILSAIKVSRNEVYIANILKCRPPDNRSPRSEEVEKCLPYLITQIHIIKPNLIVCLGLIAAKTLLKVEYNLASLRGKVFDYHGVDLIVTYHPAALLRNPNLKGATWEDFQKIQRYCS